MQVIYIMNKFYNKVYFIKLEYMRLQYPHPTHLPVKNLLHISWLSYVNFNFFFNVGFNKEFQFVAIWYKPALAMRKARSWVQILKSSTHIYMLKKSKLEGKFQKLYIVHAFLNLKIFLFYFQFTLKMSYKGVLVTTSNQHIFLYI